MFACLYTRHKTQRKKTWNDGKLILRQASALLYDANPVPGSGDPVLDECELSKNQRLSLLANKEMLLEGERFLIEVDGDWSPPSALISAKKLAVPKMSSSMNKIVKNKFKMPPPYIPQRPINNGQSSHSDSRKRKRPLQPGESIRMRESAQACLNSMPGIHRSSQQMAMTKTDENRHQDSNNKNESAAHGHETSSAPNKSNGGATTFQSNFRGRRNLYARNVQNAWKTQNPSEVQMPRVIPATERPEHEATVNIPKPAPGIFHGKRQNQTRPQGSKGSPFVPNDFDAEKFYGLEEEEETSEMNGAFPSTGFTDSNTPLSSQGGSQLQVSLRPDMTNISTQSTAVSDMVSDDALLAMFGAAPPVPTFNSTRQEPQLEEQTRHPDTDCNGAEFVLPSDQSSTGDES